MTAGPGPGRPLHAYAVEAILRLEGRAIAREGSDVLMQRAAAGVARTAAEMLVESRGTVYGSRVVLLVGGGNNGGDALFAGARLARRGARVLAVPALGEPHAAGAAALVAAGGRVVSAAEAGVEDLGDRPRPAVDLFVDGMFGIGGRLGLSGRPGALAHATHRWGVPVLAVDLPSGVDADTGAVPEDPLASVRADRTVTFGHAKPCHLIEPARSRCGRVEVVDIGLDPSTGSGHGATGSGHGATGSGHGAGSDEPDLQAVDEDTLAAAWPYPPRDGDKYARGVVGADTGSDQYPGAGVLSTLGVVHAGAGMVRFLGAERPARLIEARLPNVVFSEGRVQARLFGSGWGERPDGARVLQAALEEGLPVVVDADGLRHLPPRVPATWLLTPHAGELARLLGTERRTVEGDPLTAVRHAAEHTGATVLLKGATQLVAEPGRRTVLVALPGPSWTAQAGSGDVLGGVCAALLATGLRARWAGVLAASVQAYAAGRHPGALPPQELAPLIAEALGELQARAARTGPAR